MKDKVKSFPALSAAAPRVLILGTAPSVQSLAKEQFYAHPHNVLWRILFEIFAAPFSTDYEARKQLIYNNNIALYDTVMECTRAGSLDSKIKDMRPNDINAFLAAHNTIKKVFFNGKSAERFYKKHFRIIDGINYFVLPSTSPAYAVKTYRQKLALWQKAFKERI